MKRILSTILALTLVLSAGAIAFADNNNSITASDGSASVPVTLTAAAASFSVTVPTSLPVSVDASGNVTVADVNITNNGAGQVKVTGIQVAASSDWQLVAFDSDFSEMPANSKSFAMKIADTNVPTTGAADVSEFASIDGGETKAFVYDAALACQSSALSSSEIGTVTITMAWKTAS